MRRAEGIGWLALVFGVAIMLYPLSLSVASLRSDLARTDDRIVAVKKDIRYLETEFSARANLLQLEHWNKLEFGYVNPTASQYLDGERALANLGETGPREPVRVAVIASMNGVAPAGVIGSPIVRSDAPASPRSATKPPANRTERVADIESKLLGEGLVDDLNRRAATEEFASAGQ